MTVRVSLFILSAVFAVSIHATDSVSIRGSAVVAVPLDAAAEVLKEEVGIEYKVVTDGGSTDAIARVADGVVDFALSTRSMTQSELSQRPDFTFKEILIGRQAVFVVVPEAIWKSGVRALTREQFRGIYEQDVKNWKELGGEDRAITFYNREPGRGVWDLFAIFLYGDARKAVTSKNEVITQSSDMRTVVEFNSGGIGLLEYAELKGGELHALGIKQADGTVIEPTLRNIASGRYEMSRPMLMITSRTITDKLRDFVQFMIGPRGQEYVKKSGHVTLEELKGLPK